MYSTTFRRSLVSANTLQLTIGAGAAIEDRLHVLDFLAALELVEHIVHEVEVFENQLALGQLLLAAEIDQHAVEAVAGRRATCSP